MKVFDIAIKDTIQALRSLAAVMFMFGLPLMITGLFYLMFGNAAQQGEFDLPRVKVAVANLDTGAPHLDVSRKSLPDGIHARTAGALIVEVLKSEDMAELIEVAEYTSAEAARAAVDNGKTQVAVIVPQGFGRRFADTDTQAEIEFYQDPTQTIGPEIVEAVLGRFIDGIAGVKIAVDVALDELEPEEQAKVGAVVEAYMAAIGTGGTEAEDDLLTIRAPGATAEAEEETNPVLAIVTPIMGGMMIFYVYYTGMSVAQSIVREDEGRTLQRLFTTPTRRGVILGGKFLAVFLTCTVQVTTLLLVAQPLFGIDWGPPAAVILASAGVVASASCFGIFANSFIKSTKQGAVLFGGLMAIPGLIGLIPIFMMDSPYAEAMGETVSLLVPQGWATRGFLLAIHGHPLVEQLPNSLALLAWSVTLFGVGLWRFRKRFR